MREYLTDYHKQHILLSIVLPSVLNSIRADQVKIEHLSLKFHEYYLQLIEDLARMIAIDIKSEANYVKGAFITISDVNMSGRGISCRAKYKGSYYNLSFDREQVKSAVDGYLRAKRITTSTHHSSYVNRFSD